MSAPADVPPRQPGRAGAIGSSLPQGPYRSTPEFDEASLPKALQNTHNTKAGVWGMLNILAGTIHFIDEAAGDVVHKLKAGDVHPIQPQSDHHLELTGPVRLRVDFYDYDPLA